MIIGYARISTYDQSIDLQKDALNNAGCKRIFQDIASGAKTDRPGLEEAISFCREGDLFIVWKLDRMGRSIDLLRHFRAQNSKLQISRYFKYNLTLKL